MPIQGDGAIGASKTSEAVFDGRDKEDAVNKLRDQCENYNYDLNTLKVLKVTDNGHGTYRIEYVRPRKLKAQVRAAAFPNAADCNGCRAFDEGKGCAEGGMPGTCGHSASMSEPKAISQNARTIVPNVGDHDRHDDSPHSAGSQEIETKRIEVTGWNPRKRFDEDRLKELAESIRAIGLIEPILVRPKGSKYELVVGERRLRAARMIKAATIRAEVRGMSDDDVLDAMIAENACREDLNPIEEANHLKRVLEVGRLTQTELARRVGKSQEWVANRLRLAASPTELQALIISREITPHHALVLLPHIEKPWFQTMLDMVKDVPMKVSELERLIKRNEEPEPAETPEQVADRKAFIQEMTACMRPEPASTEVDTPSGIRTNEPTIVDAEVCTSPEEKPAEAPRQTLTELPKELPIGEAEPEGVACCPEPHLHIVGKSGSYSEWYCDGCGDHWVRSRPAKEILRRYRDMPASNTAKRELLEWAFPWLKGAV